MSPAETPRNDLQFLKAIHTYPDKEISQVALTAFPRHLWYLSETLVGLSFFDDSVTFDEKQRMVYSMRNNQGSDEPPKRLPSIHNPPTKAPLLPPKYSRSSDWMTIFLIETRNNGSQNNHTVRQKLS